MFCIEFVQITHIIFCLIVNFNKNINISAKQNYEIFNSFL